MSTCFLRLWLQQTYASLDNCHFLLSHNSKHLDTKWQKGKHCITLITSINSKYNQGKDKTLSILANALFNIELVDFDTRWCSNQQVIELFHQSFVRRGAGHHYTAILKTEIPQLQQQQPQYERNEEGCTYNESWMGRVTVFPIDVLLFYCTRLMVPNCDDGTEGVSP